MNAVAPTRKRLADDLRWDRLLCALSAGDLAALAGVSASQVSRIESCKTSPTMEMYGRLMAELGRDVSGRAVPPVSMVEYATAIAVLDRKPIPDGGGEWIERWQRARWIDDDLVLDERYQLAFTATVGWKNALWSRPGSREFKTNLSPRKVCDRIVAAGPSMMTGSYSARRFTDAAVPWGVQMYVPDPEAAEAMLEPEADGGLTVWLMSAATNMIDDDEMGDGTEPGLASFWRTVIDCYGGAKRMPEQADWMLGEQ